MGTRLYVGNLPFDVDEAQLRTLFQEGGRGVAEVKIVMDRDTGRPRGFAFVEMASQADAQAAIAAMNGREVGGRALTVNEAREQAPRGRGFGGGRSRARREWTTAERRAGGLLALRPELVEVGRPVRSAGGVRRAAPVPAAHAGDGLLAVPVLVDHVPQRLGLAIAERRTRQRERSTVHMDSWALGPRSWSSRPRGTRGP